MKKRNLKLLSLNKSSISDLSATLVGGNESAANSCIASCNTYGCPPNTNGCPTETLPTYCYTCQYHTRCGPGHCVSKDLDI